MLGAETPINTSAFLITSHNIPVFHDDQHGTAIIVLSGLMNALKIVNKKVEDLKIIVNGAGSAGTSITKLLLSYGAKTIIAVPCWSS